MLDPETRRHNEKQREKLHQLLDSQLDQGESENLYGEFGLLYQRKAGKVTLIREKAERTHTT